MLFNSYGFIFLYLPIVLGGMFHLGRYSHRLAALWLGLASLTFYAAWDARFVLLLLTSISFNYGAGYWIGLRRAKDPDKQAKFTLVAAIAANLALLGYFKYANFFIASSNQLLGNHVAALDIILPLGISFFTFTQIAFLVDVHRGIAREYNFIHYLLFVTYFPHLIAGPVLHHKEMMPQFALARNYRADWNNIANGLLLFTLGLCKKTLLADALAPYANAVFEGVQRGALPTTYEAWAGALAYTMQIYFDFSGYTDMALGASLMFNIRLPANFASPYKATSIIEFWRRWHMTLSRFLRDYLYIPLGGNRDGKLRRYLNLFATMLLGGLWHGAGWTFVVWGAIHGLYLTVNHLWRELISDRLPRLLPPFVSRITGGVLTFAAVVVAWVVFRSNDIAQATVLLKAMFAISAQPISFAEVAHGQLLLMTALSGRDLAQLLLFSLVWVWLLPNSASLKFSSRNLLFSLVQAAITVYFFLRAVDQFGSYSPFLYFQF